MEKKITVLCRNIMLFGGLLALLTSAIAFASPRVSVVYDPPGIAEALAMCSRLSFADDRQDCASFVQDARVRGVGFQVEAINVCAGASFGDDATQCMKNIAGKRYLPIEIQTCAREAFGDAKAECMARNGAPDYGSGPGTCVDTREILRDLREIRNAIRQNRPRAAQAVINALEDDLLRCP